MKAPELVITPGVQPQWLSREPDQITDVKHGVVDGVGIKHPIPIQMQLMDVGMRKFAGIWKWVGFKRAKS